MIRHTEERIAGLLMPLASLPSPEGTGCLGPDSYRFVDGLVETGVRIWQLLPLNPLGFGNSPYQPFSSFAGDELYLSLEMLRRDGLLTDWRPCPPSREPDRIDYEAARAWKQPYLRRACACFYETCADDADFAAFRAMDWVYPYAVFLALKRQNGMRAWVEWPREQQDWILDRRYDLRHLSAEIDYNLFVQYQFLRQWQALKRYANERGVLIMGDIPFYVGLDSQDVWGRREDFLLERDGRPSFIAGVPPDYFNEEGQRWGNPIYNWERMEQDGFSFWIERLRYSAELYDIIRIDHFRAFDTYWKIPADCTTAIGGEWVEAPGKALLTELFRQLPDLWIVAEDLGGDLTEGVGELRDGFGLMGMNVADFTLLSGELPTLGQLTYTATHDNQTARGLYESASEADRAEYRRILADYGSPREPISLKMVRYVFRSEAAIAIVPLADLLNLDDRGRINHPGTVGSPNWEWRLANWKALSHKKDLLRTLLRESGRETRR